MTVRVIKRRKRRQNWGQQKTRDQSQINNLKSLAMSDHFDFLDISNPAPLSLQQRLQYIDVMIPELQKLRPQLTQEEAKNALINADREVFGMCLILFTARSESKYDYIRKMTEWFHGR